MGKRKNNARRRMIKENAQFDEIEAENIDTPMATNGKGSTKKQKKKLAQKLKRMHSKGPQKLNSGDVEMISAVGKSQSTITGGGWNRVVLSNVANKWSKEEVLMRLANATSHPFTPICFGKAGQNDFEFFVESPAAAAALKAIDKTISINETFMLNIKVVPSPAPKLKLSDGLVNKMKKAMAGRYSGNALNLTKFHADPNFVGDDVYVPLARSSVMGHTLAIIAEHLPEIASLDLSDNKLPTLDHFSRLADSCIHLSAVDMSKNRIANLRELEKMSRVGLKVLSLADNPIMHKFEKADLVDKLRRIFPKLEVFNGEELPKVLTFDNQDSPVVLPESLKLMTVDDGARPVVLAFLHEYFSAFDSDNRSNLLANAYHPDAMMSMCSAYPPGSTFHGAARLTEYQSDSRNLKLVLKPSKRQNFLRQGNQSIIKFLSDFPKTTHDLDSFTLDIPFVGNNLVTFTVSGVFEERKLGHEINPVRHFNRSLVVVPLGSGFVIVNENLFITNSRSSKAGLSQSPPHNFVDLVQKLCKMSKLRPDWAKKCLEENRWNFDNALDAFNASQRNGNIPQEAYAFVL